MYAVFDFESPKRHAPVHRANAFFSPGIARKWRGIPVSRPKSGGNVRHDGQSGGRKLHRKGASVRTDGSHLPHTSSTGTNSSTAPSDTWHRG